MARLMVLLAFIISGSAQATTELSREIFTQTSGPVTATAQFVNRSQVVVSVENTAAATLSCGITVETQGYVSGPFEQTFHFAIAPDDVDAKVDSVKGNQEFGAMIKSITCGLYHPPIRFIPRY